MLLLNEKEVKFTTFPNGEFQLEEELKNLNVTEAYTISFYYSEDSGNSDIFKLFALKSHLDDQGIKSVQLYLTYTPFSRMDRTEGTGLIFTLKYFAKLINSMSFSKVYVLEPHSNVTAALLDRVSIVDGTLSILSKIHDTKENVLLVYPDEGAKKRYTVSNNCFDIALGMKNRDFKTGKITSFEISGKETKAKRAIILDDLTSYGGTFKATKAALIEKYPDLESIELIVTHAENSMLKSALPHEFDHIYTTDSILTELDNWENVKFKDKVTVFNSMELIKEKEKQHDN